MKSNIQLRNEEISTLLEVIRKKEFYKENSEHGLVILLNGEWGTGKTTFINQFVGMINSQDDIELFNNYNAYENDYYENAYIPFFASIDDKIKLRKEFTNFIKSVGGATGKGLVVVSYAITKSIFKKKFDIDVDDIKNNLKEIQDEEVNNDLLNEYKDFHKYKNKIKESMNSICKNKTQIFIIDELDRCKPSFAMETLEIVKHFFDVKNCVFIIAVDKVQLEESIKTIYGNGINSEKYFSKLFDYQFNLLPISFYDSVDITDMPNANELVKWSAKIFDTLEISLRDSKKIFNELIQKNKDWTIEQSLFMLFLITLKYTDLSFYKAIINKDYFKYKKMFEGQYNREFEKYNKLFSFKIGDGLTYGKILEELNIYINKKFSDVRVEMSKSKRSIGSTLREESQIAKDLITYIPEITIGLTIKENIKKIIN